MDKHPEEQPPIQSETQEKMGLLWLTDLHRKLETIRALRLRLVREQESFSEDEAMDLVLNINANLAMLVETEIKPLAANRGEWTILKTSIEESLVEADCDTLDPDDPEFFSFYTRYVDIVLGEIEKALELYGMKVSPWPTSPDVVGIAWAAIEKEAASLALQKIQIKWDTIKLRRREPREPPKEEDDG